MAHPEKEQMLALIDGTATGPEAETLRRHLSGCARCRGRAAELEKLVSALRGRHLENPPEWLMAWSEDLPRAHPRPVRSAPLRTLKLTFDSWTLLPAGARSSPPANRRLVFRTGSVDLDIELESLSGARKAIVRGQLLDASVPGGRTYVSGEVRLLRGRRLVARAALDARGDFVLPAVGPDTYSLRIEARGLRCRVNSFEV